MRPDVAPNRHRSRPVPCAACCGFFSSAVSANRYWSLPSLTSQAGDWTISRDTMTDEQLQLFLARFDRSIPTGHRDYAMALCQVDLGLRVSEVSALRLEDLDWRAATLRIEGGKSRRTRLLPLTDGVGRAIAEYLRQGRPTTNCRHIFVRHTTPVGTAIGTELIRGADPIAFAQVEGCAHWTGTHALRHTAATRLHRGGASLKEVADLLGHQSIDTTAIYAKVDLPTLATVALPWPEGQP